MDDTAASVPTTPQINNNPIAALTSVLCVLAIFGVFVIDAVTGRETDIEIIGFLTGIALGDGYTSHRSRR